MSYLRGKEALMAWFDAHNEDANEPKPYWGIYADKNQHSTGKAVFAKSPDSPNLSHKESKILFERVVDKMFSPSTSYFIVLKESANATTKMANATYSSPNEVAGIGNIGEPVDIESRIQAGIAAYEERKEKEALQKRIAELEKANKELEKEVTPEWMNKIGSVISGLMDNPNVVNGIMGTATTKPNNQMGAVKTQEQQNTDQLRLERVLEKFNEVDPDFLDSLEKLQKLAEENPAKYNMAKSML
jgi:hypothetical protein